MGGHGLGHRAGVLDRTDEGPDDHQGQHKATEQPPAPRSACRLVSRSVGNLVQEFDPAHGPGSPHRANAQTLDQPRSEYLHVASVTGPAANPMALKSRTTTEPYGVGPVKSTPRSWRRGAGVTSHNDETRAEESGGPTVRIGLLGGFEVSEGDRMVAHSAWRLRKAKTLIKLLALEPTH